MANRFTNTPEALLGRNDSKNPATTCKGLTGSGRPCRRALALSSVEKRASSVGGVVAIVEDDGNVTEADFYCWQHKDQAEQLIQQHESTILTGRGKKKRQTELFPLQEKSSVDTLVQKLGIEAVPHHPRPKAKPTAQSNNGAKPPRGSSTQDFARPSSAAPLADKYYTRPQPLRQDSSRRKKHGFWSSLCCAANQDDDYVEIVRHRRRMEQSQKAPETIYTPDASPMTLPCRPSSHSLPLRPSPASSSSWPRPHGRSSSHPRTGHLLSLIPQGLSPQTTSSLLAELIKPISPADEDGYIYIFWLTPQSKTAPGESTARSLLAPPTGRPQGARRISDVMTEYSYNRDDERTRDRPGKDSSAIMLKIGRANNVTRRMNEWQRQCGFALNLVRWYPYVPSSAAPSPAHSPRRTSSTGYPDLSRSPASRRDSQTVHKVPFVKRVERLIHLELAEQQVKKQCAACGKEHREWFQVEATQEGVKRVDSCVRRWADWAEKEAIRQG